METLSRTKGCLHDNGANLAQARVHSCFLSWFCICLHVTITQVFKPVSGRFQNWSSEPPQLCHAGASLTGVSSPRLLYRSENFSPVRNFVTLLCKLKTTSRFRWTGTGSTCVVFVNSGWRHYVVHGTRKNIQTCKRDMKSGSHPGMKLAPVRVFSC